MARVSFVCQQTHDWLDDKARWKIDGYVFYVPVPHLENSAVDETDGRFFAQRRRIKGVIDGCKLGSRKDFGSLGEAACWMPKPITLVAFVDFTTLASEKKD